MLPTTFSINCLGRMFFFGDKWMDDLNFQHKRQIWKHQRQIIMCRCVLIIEPALNYCADDMADKIY